MNLREWWGLYSSICEDFSFLPQRDYLSSLILSNIIGMRRSESALNILTGRKVAVVGNAENSASLIPSISNSAVIVADSALEAYYDVKGPPDIIVSDLDGNLDLISSCSREGSKLVIHSHGDNTNLVASLNRTLGVAFVGTTQNIPLWNVSNYGGFTDGDRAAFIADAFGAASITLVGFDFDNPNGKKKSDIRIKRKKLEWAEYLLRILAYNRQKEFVRGDFIEI